MSGRALLLFFSLGAVSLAREPRTVKDSPRFESAEKCAKCHTRQFEEWKGSMMHYSAQSPVFQAFELKARKLTGRFGAHDRENPTLCINCHSPQGASRNEMAGLLHEEPAGKVFSKVASEGITCTMCHSVRGPDNTHFIEKGLLGDGISNANVDFFPLDQLVGPTAKEPLPQPNDYHLEGFSKNKEASRFLTSSQFCGSCHDVRLPQTPDRLTGEPFQRIENLFTEWEKGPYNGTKNPFGKVTSCTDCHMSLYGSMNSKTGKVYPPGEFPQAQIAKGYPFARKHALHAFTAVSRTLIDDPETFPNQDTPEKDSFGFPKGQEQRRRQMLAQACSLDFITGKPREGGDALDVELRVVNSGAGHRVPSGFSQERQVWLSVEAATEKGEVFFRSGNLIDRAHPETGEKKPDGREDDEDLEDELLTLNPRTFEVRQSRLGRDFNLRPFKDVGVPQFNNAFVRQNGPRQFERVHFFTLPTHIDNDRALPMLVPVPIRYEIPLAALREKFPAYCGNVRVTATLRYRTLPPKILRTLIATESALLNEAQIDRNSIVDMKSATGNWKVCLAESVPAAEPSVAPERQVYRFERAGVKWIGYYLPLYHSEAVEACRREGCELPTVAQYDSLGLAEYVAQPGDNKDELWKERWTSEILKSKNPRATPAAKTYLFSAGADREGKLAIDEGSLTPLPFFCHCGGRS